MKQTPLYEKHLEAGGKMIDFCGWALPVQYRGIIEEHEAVRKRAGLFDVSHMGVFWMQGSDVLANLQRLVTNDLSKASDNQAIYSPMCREDGGVLDDLLLYRIKEDIWQLVVNAVNTQKDKNWIQSHLRGQATLSDITDETAQVAIQGPRAEAILQRLTTTDLGKIRFYRFMTDVYIADVPVLISRTGYTGEDGFELYFNAKDAPMLWERILDEGYPDGLTPAGLGARDTLRFEAALPLYGQELSEEITPLEAGLERFVKFEKYEFISREALLKQKEKGPERMRIGLEMEGRGVPRPHYVVQREGCSVGFVTSGTFAPTLKKNLAMALVNRKWTDLGCRLGVEIRNRLVPARVVALPFYKRPQPG